MGKRNRFLLSLCTLIVLGGCSAAKPETNGFETNYVETKRIQTESGEISTETANEMNSNSTKSEDERYIVFNSSLFPMEEGTHHNGLDVQVKQISSAADLNNISEIFQNQLSQDDISFWVRSGALQEDGKVLGRSRFIEINVTLTNRNSVETIFNLAEITLCNLDTSGERTYIDNMGEICAIDKPEFQGQKAFRIKLDSNESKELNLLYLAVNDLMNGIEDGTHKLALSIINGNPFAIKAEDADSSNGSDLVFLLLDIEDMD